MTEIRRLPGMSSADRQRLESHLGQIHSLLGAMIHFFCGPEAILKLQLGPADVAASEEFLKTLLNADRAAKMEQQESDTIPDPHIPTKEELN